MFSNRIQLKNRTPDNGVDRENFLSLLVDEYFNTSLYDAKCQVLANLANFAYDPINYTYIRDVGVLDIFLYVVKNETDNKLLLFSTAGLCNLCLDPDNAAYIHTYLGIKPVIALLKNTNNEIIANVVTTLMYLYNDNTKPDILTTEIKQCMEDYAKSDCKMLANLATIFLQDFCRDN